MREILLAMRCVKGAVPGEDFGRMSQWGRREREEMEVSGRRRPVVVMMTRRRVRVPAASRGESGGDDSSMKGKGRERDGKVSRKSVIDKKSIIKRCQSKDKVTKRVSKKCQKVPKKSVKSVKC